VQAILRNLESFGIFDTFNKFHYKNGDDQGYLEGRGENFEN